MGTANRVVKNTGILYVKMGITVFISLYTTRLILAALGVNDFGIYNVVGGAIAMLTFLNNAMSTATQRFMSFAEGAGDHDKQRSIFNVSIVLHFLIAVIIFFILEFAGHFLFNGVLKIPIDRIASAKMVYQFMVISTLFTIISVPYDAVINAHENMLLYSILGVLESLFKLGIAIYISNAPYDKLSTYGLLTALLSILLLFIRRFYCSRYYDECKINIGKYFKKKIFLELTHFAGWSFLGASTSMITNYGQGILMNIFFGPVVNTAQGIANQVSGQLGTFAGTMQKALNPIIAKSEGAGERNLMLKAATMGSKVSFFLLMVFCIPIIIEMPYVFDFWLKDVPEYAIIFCRLLLIKNLIDQLFITLTVSISAVGKIKRFQIFMSIIHILPIFFAYGFFLMDYPPYSIYIIFWVYSFFGAILTLYFAKVLCNLSIKDYLLNVVSRCVLTFFIIISICYLPTLLLKESIIRLTIVVSLNLFLFIGIGWFVGFSNSERTQIFSFLKNGLKKFKKKQLTH